MPLGQRRRGWQTCPAKAHVLGQAGDSLPSTTTRRGLRLRRSSARGISRGTNPSSRTATATPYPPLSLGPSPFHTLGTHMKTHGQETSTALPARPGKRAVVKGPNAGCSRRESGRDLTVLPWGSRAHTKQKGDHIYTIRRRGGQCTAHKVVSCSLP